MDAIIAGAAAGMAVDAALFPLDTIKTRMQAKVAAETAAKVAGKQRSFYAGLASAMAASAPCAATFWYTYESSKVFLVRLFGESSPSPAVHACSAALADVAVTAVRNPFEVVKQQVQAGLHANSATALRALLRAGGVRALYTGYIPTLAREVPFDAVEFTLYEAAKAARMDTKRAGRPAGEKVDLSLAENAALGCVCGGIAAAVTTPLDVVKTRVMTQAGTAAPRYAGWLDALVRIPREEGPRALFAGLLPRVAWISIGGAVFIGSFEEVRRWVRADR